MAGVVVLSGGGIKGAVAAARYAPENEILLLHVDYGQPAAPREVRVLEGLKESFPAAHSVTVDLPHLGQIPERLNAAFERAARSGKRGVGDEARVPAPATLLGLMPVLLSVGVQCAHQAGASRVVTGLSGVVDAGHLGLPSPKGQPGRRWEFIHAFNIMIETLSSLPTPVRVEAPLMDLTYSEIVKLALHFQIPVDKTWTCIQGNRQPCQACAPCRARAAALTEAFVPG